MFRHILVASDGSALSESAIRAGVQLAAIAGARATFVTCTRPYEAAAADAMASIHRELYEAGAENAAHARLQDALSLARANAVSTSGEHVYAEHAFQGILDTAQLKGCDLIVMASRGRKRVASVLLGSETLAVLTHSKVPVLVCPGGREPTFQSLLAATDGSELSVAAVRLAIDLAAANRARVSVITCSMPYPVFKADLGMELQHAQYDAFVENAARRRLSAATDYAAAKGVQVACEHVQAREPWHAIVETAESGGADLIVMASHGRRGTAALVLGSETLKVLTHAKLPVLVCR